MPEAMAGGRPETHQQGLGWAEQRGETHSVLRRLGRFLVTADRNVVTTAIVIILFQEYVLGGNPNSNGLVKRPPCNSSFHSLF
jgi:hypothetical protein